jgi:hypothetical protein
MRRRFLEALCLLFVGLPGCAELDAPGGAGGREVQSSPAIRLYSVKLSVDPDAYERFFSSRAGERKKNALERIGVDDLGESSPDIALSLQLDDDENSTSSDGGFGGFTKDTYAPSFLFGFGRMGGLEVSSSAEAFFATVYRFSFYERERYRFGFVSEYPSIRYEAFDACTLELEPSDFHGADLFAREKTIYPARIELSRSRCGDGYQGRIAAIELSFIKN